MLVKFTSPQIIGELLRPEFASNKCNPLPMSERVSDELCAGFDPLDTSIIHVSVGDVLVSSGFVLTL